VIAFNFFPSLYSKEPATPTTCGWSTQDFSDDDKEVLPDQHTDQDLDKDNQNPDKDNQEVRQRYSLQPKCPRRESLYQEVLGRYHAESVCQELRGIHQEEPGIHPEELELDPEEIGQDPMSGCHRAERSPVRERITLMKDRQRKRKFVSSQRPKPESVGTKRSKRGRGSNQRQRFDDLPLTQEQHLSSSSSSSFSNMDSGWVDILRLFLSNTDKPKELLSRSIQIPDVSTLDPLAILRDAITHGPRKAEWRGLYRLVGLPEIEQSTGQYIYSLACRKARPSHPYSSIN
jgi:hypothetical protein